MDYHFPVPVTADYQQLKTVDILPRDYPYNTTVYYTEQQTIALYNRKRDRLEEMSERLNLLGWISVNQVAPVSLEVWIGESDWQRQYGVDDEVKEALAMEVEKVLMKRESARKDIERRQEMKLAQNNSQNMVSQRMSLDKHYGR